MDFVFERGMAIGFAIAAPIGPVGVLCINKAMADGRAAAIVAGLGAALADTIFGAVVGLGLGQVSLFLSQHQLVLKLVGGLFMAVLGIKTWMAAFATGTVELPRVRGPAMWRDFVATFLITITNPATILGVMGVFAALGTSNKPAGQAQSLLLVLGVFAGSTLWWLVLSTLASAARSRFTPDRMRLFNHLSGALLITFGALALGSLLLP